MPTVKYLLKQKGSQVWTIEANASVRDALVLLAEKKIGAAPVMENDKIVGIFSERDFARYAAFAEDPYKPAAVRELMVSPVFFVSPDQTIEDCMNVMTAKHLRHLPVLENEKLIGMITIGDVIKHIIAEKESTIHDLEHFLWVNMI